MQMIRQQKINLFCQSRLSLPYVKNTIPDTLMLVTSTVLSTLRSFAHFCLQTNIKNVMYLSVFQRLFCPAWSRCESEDLGFSITRENPLLLCHLKHFFMTLVLTNPSHVRKNAEMWQS